MYWYCEFETFQRLFFKDKINWILMSYYSLIGQNIVLSMRLHMYLSQLDRNQWSVGLRYDFDSGDWGYRYCQKHSRRPQKKMPWLLCKLKPSWSKVLTLIYRMHWVSAKVLSSSSDHGCIVSLLSLTMFRGISYVIEPELFCDV